MSKRLTFGAARSHGSKVQKFNSLGAYMSGCQYLPMDFYCLSASPPYALSKTMKISMAYSWHFCYKATNIQYLRKLVALKNL